MIVRDRPSGLRLFLLLRGSILQRIRWTLLFNTLLATAVSGWRERRRLRGRVPELNTHPRTR